MTLRTYIEKGIDLVKAKTGWLSHEDEHVKRHGTARLCVDGFLEYTLNGQTGILMAYRDGVPPHSHDLWVPGGEWKRGIADPIDALRVKIKEETNLDISDPEYLGIVSILWIKSPYDTEKLREERKRRNLGEGVHDVGLEYFAKATGNLKLKTMNPPIVLVTRENYDEVMDRYNAHPYLRDFARDALEKIK